MIIISRRLCFGHKARFYCSSLGESLVRVLVGAGSEVLGRSVVFSSPGRTATNGRADRENDARAGRLGERRIKGRAAASW